MLIWIMRHGEAGFNAPTDRQRTLTEQGKRMAYTQGQWLARRLNDQQFCLDYILVSPYQRTQQTYEQVTNALQAVGSTPIFANVAQITEMWEGITPLGDADNVVNYLDFLRTKGTKNILVISHLPLVDDLVHTLTNFQQRVPFSPAVIAEIAWATNQGQLVITKAP